VHEQVSNIISGAFEMTVDGVTKVCKAGDIVILPSNVPHSGRALTDCYIIDVFQPVREDYKKL
ncbi:MAG TPA: cupin domain-containing protein, partial [Saprospiraceae bacterium]|nr:cupin domain-containing protein [Saprospiraceae bacterium]